MEDIKNMSLDKVRRLYRELIENFKKEDLEKPSQEEFDKVFFNLLDRGMNFIRFVNKYNHIEITKFDDIILFDINYDPKNPHFWFSYNVLSIFEEKFGLELSEIKQYMRNVLDNHLKMEDVEPILKKFINE